MVDVGSGGGTPGIPLAVALPDRDVTLLESERRKCRFLERWTAELPNLASCLGTGGGAAARDARYRRRKGPRAASRGGGVVPAAGRAGRHRHPLGGAVGRFGARGAGGRAGRRRADRLAGRLPHPPQDGADTGRLSSQAWNGEETAARVGGARSASACPREWGCARPRLRDREPERRRRQDDDRGEPGRLPGGGGRACASGRPRPPGECDVGPRRACKRRVDARSARRGAARTAGAADSVRQPRSRPAKPTLAAAAVELSARDDGERYLADALGEDSPAGRT